MRNIISVSNQLNCELKFFFFLTSGPPAKRFANLSEEQLHQLVEKIPSENTQKRNNKLVCINFSKLVIHSGNFRENFKRFSEYNNIIT